MNRGGVKPEKDGERSSQNSLSKKEDADTKSGSLNKESSSEEPEKEIIADEDISSSDSNSKKESDSEDKTDHKDNSKSEDSADDKKEPGVTDKEDNKKEESDPENKADNKQEKVDSADKEDNKQEETDSDDKTDHKDDSKSENTSDEADHTDPTNPPEEDVKTPEELEEEVKPAPKPLPTPVVEIKKVATPPELTAPIPTEEYEVEFQGNGGSYQNQKVWSVSCKKGEKIYIGQYDPSWNGHVFTGWYLDAACTEAVENNYYFKPEEDCALYAGWKEAYTITYDYNGISYEGETSKDAYVQIGKSLDGSDPYFSSNPMDTGNKVLKGWMTEAGKLIRKNELYKYIPTADETLTAVWSDYYSVEVDYNGPTGSDYRTRTYYVAQGEKFANQPYLKSEEYDGKRFAGWYSEANKRLYNQYGNDGVYDYIPMQNDRLVAQWSAYYTVTYDLNGGQIASYSKDIEYVVEGKAITGAPSVTKDGYVFAGWKIAGTDTFVQNRVYIPTADVTLVAQWAEYWTINYDANGGTFKAGVTTSSHVEMGSSAYLMGSYNVSREGYILEGWCEDPAGTGTVYTGYYTPSGNTTLYAKWARSCEVTLDAGEGNFGSSEHIQVLQIMEGKSVGSKLSTPIRNGYGFGGWYLDTAYTQKVNYAFEPTENVRLYARWIEETYTVTLHAGGNYISTDVAGEYASEQSIQVTPGNAVPYIRVYRNNYTLFWYLDEACTKPIRNLTSYIPTGDVDLYAGWKKNITISWDADGGRDSSGQLRGTRTIAEGASFSMSAPEKAGYAFVGWYTSDGRKITKTTNLYEDTSVVARWEKNDTYTCKVTIDLAGGDEENFNGKKYLPYTYVESGSKLSNYGAPEREGYGFVGWLSSSDGKIYKYLSSMVIQEDLTLTAQWKQGCKITLHADGGWFSGYKAVKEVYLADGPISAESIFHTPFRDDDQTFVGWSRKPNGTVDDVIDLDTYSFTENMDLYAVWGEYWTLTAVLNGGHYLTNAENTATTFEVVKGKKASSPKASQMTREGFTFGGWYLTSDFTGAQVQIPGFVPTEDTWIYAKWIPGDVKLWTVHFDGNGGSEIPDAKVADGESLTRAGEPSREGYVFNGWYTDAACTILYDFDSVVTADMTLYAGWTETRDLKDAAVTVIGSYTYTGESIVPEVDVRIGGRRLTKGVDYTVHAEDNIHAGEASVTITAVGSSYVGSKTVEFIIERAEAPAPALPSDPIPAIWGMKLSSLNSQLPEGWKWYKSGDTALNRIGEQEEIVIFPALSEDYKERRDKVLISVAQRSIEGAEITLTNEKGQIKDEFVYTQEGVKPNVIVKLDGVKLQDVYYEVTYEDNDKVGEASVIIRGAKYYTGEVRKNFTITAADPAMDIANQTYEAHYGDLLSSIKLPEGWNWQDGSVTVGAATGTGYREFLADFKSSSPNYVDKTEVKLKVKVQPKWLRASNGVHIELDKKYYIYDGMKHEPKVVVRDDVLGTVLKEGTDYTVRYMFSDILSGTGDVPYAYAEISGKGNYTETMLADYYIISDPYDLNKASVSVETPVTYTGKAIEPKVTVTAHFLDEEHDRLDTKTLTEGVDYTLAYEDNVEPGYGKVTITGTGAQGESGYYGSQTVHFRIEAVNYTLHAVYGERLGELRLPTGWNWKTPEIFVGDVTGGEGRNFEADYSLDDRTDQAEFLVIVSAKNIDDSSVKLLDWTGDCTYTEGGSKPKLRLYDEKTERDLVEGVDYEVSYSQNAGENLPFTIRGIHNYTGERKLTYTMHPGDPEPEIKADIVKNGKIELTIKDKPFFLYAVCKGDGVLSFESSDSAVFTVEKRKNDYGEENDGYVTVTGLGTAVLTVTVSSSQNYKAAVKMYDVIVREAGLENSNIKLSGNSYTYTGAQIRPDFTVTVDGETLQEGIDYEVLYGENVKAGKEAGSITIQGKGRYIGFAAISFDILKAENPALVPKVTFSAAYGQKVSEFTLPDGWKWENPEYILEKSGKVKAVLPETENYLEKEAEVEFTVAEPVIPVPDPTPTPGTDNGSEGHQSGRDKGASSWKTLPDGYQGATRQIRGVIVPADVVDGDWTADIAGNWSFTDTAGNIYTNTWCQVYNSYSNRVLGQLPYGWFLFNETGYMRTGWVTESDGNTYYLNPVSDNTQGMMLTGWQLIDGKWYYFNEISDGTKGRLLRSTVTPDGYTVDANGIWDGQGKKEVK